MNCLNMQWSTMRAREPDILLLPFLLPLFIVGSIPLLLLAFLGYAGLGLAGLLMILAAQRDEFDATSTIVQQTITQGALSASDRAAQSADVLTAIRLGHVLIAAGVVSIACSIVGLYLSS